MQLTLKQFRERVAPIMQWPVTMRRATWLDDETIEWSMQYPGVLDAGARAYDAVRREYPDEA